ncbi:unnamed protein product [Rhizoctonia solani]|uniref:Peptidase A1 domain-containing protein n=1 Tax=Rhizoctonia solani TaxID=456999 RepID=A0A8H3CQ55_9AGAM|nr:unnamed protein product [Rhizoctonia solani]
MLSSIAIAALIFTSPVTTTPVGEPGTTSIPLDKCGSLSKDQCPPPVLAPIEGTNETETEDSLVTNGRNKPFCIQQKEPLIDEQEALFFSGACPNKYTGAITWAPLISKTWITEGTLNIESNAAYTGRMMIHSEANLITGSPETVKHWWSNVPGSEPCNAKFCDPADYYTFPCSSPPSVSFTFGGKEFPISFADFNLGPADSTGISCVGAVTGLGGAPKDAWVVGENFVKNIYTVFDEVNSRVGFATPA